MNVTWPQRSPGAPKSEGNVLVVLYVTTCDESPTGEVSPSTCLRGVNSIGPTQAVISLLATRVMMILMRKAAAFSQTTAFLEAVVAQSSV